MNAKRKPLGVHSFDMRTANLSFLRSAMSRLAFIGLSIWIMTGPQPARAVDRCVELFAESARAPRQQDLSPREARALLKDLAKSDILDLPVPLIPFLELQGFREISTNGVNSNGKAFLAELRGQTVFIKLLKERSVDGAPLAESQWLYVLNKMRLGPKLLGHVVIDGGLALVTEHLEGVDSKSLLSRHAQAPIIRQSMVDEMLEAARVLTAARIRTLDLQFLFTRDGHAVLIDPEFFSAPFLGPSEEAFPEAEVKFLIKLLQNRGHLATKEGT